MQHSVRSILLLIIICFGGSFRSAYADCELGACFGMGTELATVNSDDGAVLNLLTQLLLGSSVDISVANWNGLVDVDVNLLSLLNAVQLQAGVGSTTEALDADITLLELIDVTITALENEGATSLNALRSEVLGIPDINKSIQLFDLIKLAGTEEALLDVDLNVFHLLMGAFQLFNSKNVAVAAVSVNTASVLDALGLGTLASNVDISLHVIESPEFHCGPTTTTVRSAATRLKLDISLLDNFDISTTLGLASVDLDVTNLSLYVDLAPAEATLNAVNPNAGTVDVNVTSGLVRVYLGEFDDATFFDPTYSVPTGIDVLMDLDYATLGSVDLSVTVLTVTTTASADVGIRSYAEATQTTSGLVFSSFPSTITVDSSTSVVSTLVSSLVNNLEVDIDGSGLTAVLSILGVGVDALVTVLKPLIADLLSDSLLSPILTNVVDNVLSPLGVSIGKATVFVNGIAGACSISGLVYEDNNTANDTFDSGEDWSDGVGLWVHVTQGGSLIQSVNVKPGIGAFSFSGLPLGDYVFLVSDKPGATSAAAPENWVFVAPVTGEYAVTFNAVSVSDIYFGLQRAHIIFLGRVFIDDGVGGGTANDGIQQGSERSVVGAEVILRETFLADGAEITRVETDSNGDYRITVSNARINEPVALSLLSPDGYILIDISEGDSGGTFNDALEHMAITLSDENINGVNIALVPPSTLNANVEVVSGAGKRIFTSHRFTAGSAGLLTLTSIPATTLPTGWNSVLYNDANCNETWDDGEEVINAAITLNAGTVYCVLQKIFISASAQEGAQARWDINAVFELNNTISEDLNNYDLVSISERYAGALLLLKSVDKATALPGETLQYTIEYENTGSEPISNLIIYDHTPAFTVFDSSDCDNNLGKGLTACNAVLPALGSSGSLQWTFSDRLSSSSKGSLQFDVVISP